MASGGERHTTRHTGGVRTAKLGAFQRRLLVALLNLAWDEARDKSVDLADVRIKWKPSKEPPPGFDSAKDAPALSKAAAALSKRRLLIVYRHDGGRAYAVRLTNPGVDVAMTIQRLGGHTIEQKQAELASQLPRELVAFVPVAQRLIRRTSAAAECKEAARRFLGLYDRWTGDPDVGFRGTGNETPGLHATGETLTQLLEAHADTLTRCRLSSSNPDK